MKVKSIIFFFVAIISLLAIISCKEKPKVKIKKTTKINRNEVKIEFNFPDTVYKNKMYNGEIKYYGSLDTVSTNVIEEKNGIYRCIIYSFKKTNTINYNFEQLKKMQLDSVGAIDNNTIPFYHIKFTEIGTYYLDGIINDYVSMDNNTLNKSKNKVRVITEEARVNHKVIVINK